MDSTYRAQTTYAGKFNMVAELCRTPPQHKATSHYTSVRDNHHMSNSRAPGSSTQQALTHHKQIRYTSQNKHVNPDRDYKTV